MFKDEEENRISERLKRDQVAWENDIFNIKKQYDWHFQRKDNKQPGDISFF